MGDTFSTDTQIIVGACVAVLLAVLIIVLILVNNSMITVPKKKHRVKNDRKAKPIDNRKSTDSISNEKVEEMPPAELFDFDEDIEKVMRIIGVSEPADSLQIIDDVLKDKIDDAAQKIAKKLSISSPRIIINKETTPKAANSGRNVVAEVLISAKNEAVFGTQDFNYQTINIKVYPGYNAYPDKFIYIMAHELCHKILHSLDPKRGQNEQDERETDIAVVVSGFGNSYISAKTIDNKLGYLNVIEARYLKEKTDKMLDKIKAEKNNAHDEYLAFRRAHEEKVVFLNTLYKAKKLRDEDGWSIDYAFVGDDYNNLLVCTKSIDVDDLKEYWKICEFFKHINNADRYSLQILEAEKRLAKFKKIIYDLKLPEFECLSLLKKYL